MSKSWRYRNPSPDQRPGNLHPDPEAIELIQRSLGRLAQSLNREQSSEVPEVEPSLSDLPPTEPPSPAASPT